METRCPPGMYPDPPDFDIELEEFASLPLRRLEAFRLLREGHATKASDASSEEKASTADARLLLLHGHSDRLSEAKHRRADLASHFILKLACSGGTSSDSSSSSSSSESGNRESGGSCGIGGNGGGDVGAANNDKDRGEQEADRRRSRREWFVRAEKDLFEARLRWHLRQGAGAPPQRRPGGGVVVARGAGKCSSGYDDAGGDHSGGGDGGSAALHEKPQMSAEASRCEALRVVYDLGWLRPAEPAAGSRAGVGRTAPGEQEGNVAGSGGRGGGSGGVGGGGAAGKRRRDRDDPFREKKPDSPSSRPPPLAPGARNSSGMVVRYTACPFQKALSLVRSRQVVLRHGKALLLPEQVPQVVVGHFEGLLRDSLAVAARGLPAVEADERVSGVLRQVRRAVDALVYGGGGSSGGSERSAVVITLANIEEVAAKHFPLCMRRALCVLRREHHLKHEARLQLASFLGNAGMEVGELLALWREEFPKGMPADEYTRKKNKYEYSIRHLYGLEGKREAYSSQSCARIASVGGGGSGEGGYGHGCPFHVHPQVPGGGSGGCGTSANDTSVPGMLAAQGLPAADIEDIVGPLKTRTGGGGGALGACRRHFSATHRRAVAGGGVWSTGGQGMQEASPNGWLASSSALSLPPQQGEGQVSSGGEQAGFLTQEGHTV